MSPSVASATCANHDGNVGPGTCRTPQNLTAPVGTISAGATLTTGAATAYTISGANATLNNFGTITDATNPGKTVFVLAPGVNINNSGTISNSSSSRTYGFVSATIINRGAGRVNNLTNSGIISSVANDGIFLSAVKGNITNSGTISAHASAINVSSVTGDVINSGKIIGETGFVTATRGIVGGSFINSGTIDGAVIFDGTVGGSVINSGTITGAVEGLTSQPEHFLRQPPSQTIERDVTNSGTITAPLGLTTANVRGQLTNSGTLQGLGIAALSLQNTVQGGIVNTATGKIQGLPAPSSNCFFFCGNQGVGILVSGLQTAGLNNAGVISSQGSTAIIVSGRAATDGQPAFPANLNLTNTGTISGGIISISLPPHGDATNVTLRGVISPAANLDRARQDAAGVTVVGVNPGGPIVTAKPFGTALDYRNATDLSTITQAGGSIEGDILLSAHGDNVNVTGGTVIGDINGNSAQNGANAGMVNFALGNGGAFTTQGAIDAANINVNSGTLVLANDVTAFNALTNNATLRLDNTGARTVTGSFVQNADGTFAVTVTPTSASQLAVTKSATLNGGAVDVLAQNGAYAPHTKYTILTANAGVTGRFASVTSNLAFLAPSLSYDADDVFLTLITAAPMTSACVSFNQCAVAGALTASPTNSALALAVLNQTSAGALQAFDALSGEVYASTQTVLLDDSLFLREAVLGRLRQSAYAGGFGPMAALGAGGPALAYRSGGDPSARAAAFPIKAPPLSAAPPYVFWAQGVGSFGHIDGDGNAAAVDSNLAGFFTGVDRQFGPNWLAGIAAGYTNSSFSIGGGRASSANINTAHVAGYAGANYGPWHFRGGVAGSFSSLDTSRTIAFPGFLDTASARYDASTVQAFGEVGYGFTIGQVAAEPFGGLAWVHVSSDGFTEDGGKGIAALSGSGAGEDIGYSTLGARFAVNYTLANGMSLTPRVTAAWQHAFGDITPAEALTFQSTGASFTADGVPLARDAALVEAGFDLHVNPQITLGISYFGELSEHVQQNGVQGNFTWRF